MNTGPENVRDVDLDTPLNPAETLIFEEEPSRGDDRMEDSGDWTVMMVTMEDCKETMTNKPTLEQANIQPSTYASVVSVTNSHNHPIKIESFLRDLDLVTPESLRGMFKLHTPAQGGDCFFASLAQQPPFLKNKTATQLRMALRDFILDTGVKVIYRNAHFPMDVVSQDVGKITLAGIEQMETFVQSELLLCYRVRNPTGGEALQHEH